MPLALRRAVRSLWRYPTITMLAVLALGLGIGLPTAMFSIVDAAIIRGLPIAEPRRLMHLERRSIGSSGEGTGAAARDYLLWSEQQKSFVALGAFRTSTVTLRVGSNVDRWAAAFITPNSFAILGAAALKGRVFRDEDVRAGTPTILLSFNAWRDRYGSDAELVGQTIYVDGIARTVVGVMPPAFRFPSNEDAWLPLAIPASAADDAQFPTLDVFGTLRAGTSKQAARVEFAIIAKHAAKAYPASNRGLEVTVKPFAERFIGETASAQMYVILAAVLLVLVVACANVANLLLVRAVHRTREVAIAMALGASRADIVSQLLIESLLLAVVGSAVGLVITHFGITVLTRAFISKLPYWVEPRMDGRVLLFGLMLTIGAAVLAALVPALRTTVGDLSRTLRDDSRGATGASSGRIMQGLVIVELALSMGLLVNTSMLSLAATRAKHVEIGIPRAGLLTARVSVPERFSSTDRLAFFQQLEQRISNDPSVAGAGMITSLPGTHAPFRRVAIEGTVYANNDKLPGVRYAAASPSGLQALQLRAIRGRIFEEHDVASNGLVAVVNQRFVARFLVNVEPLGHRIRFGTADSLPWRTIVGVVPNFWMGAFDAAPDPNPAGVYLPLAQAIPSSVSIAVQSKTGGIAASASVLRAAAFAVNPEVPVYEVRDVPQIVDDGTWFYGMVAGILGVCGASALLLATIGVYSVIAFSVGARRREFGVRMALGADAPAIVRLVVGKGVAQVAAGLGLGALLAAGLARGLGVLVFDVSPTDSRIFGVVAIVLAAVALSAMLIPSLSAARIEPTEALRAD